MIDWIGPTLSGLGGAFVLWISQLIKKSWEDRQSARANRQTKEDILFLSVRELTDEVGRLRALGRHHEIPQGELGPLIVTSWDAYLKGKGRG